MKKLFIILVIISTFTAANCAEQAGVISEFKGRVSIYEGDSPRAENVSEANTPVFPDNKIITKSASSAILDLINGDRVALAEKSIMSILGPEEFRPWDGKVIFHIKKRGGVSGVKVSLTSAVIGVKGTKFLIDAEKSTEKYDVFLKEGQIECFPIEGQFKMYKKVVLDEYQSYLKKLEGELEDYIKKLEEEFVEYVDSFVMKPGDAFTVSGQEVRKLDFTSEIHEVFEILENIEKGIFKGSEEHEKDISTTDDAPAQTPAVKQPEESETEQGIMKDDFDKEFESDFGKDDY